MTKARPVPHPAGPSPVFTRSALVAVERHRNSLARDVEYERASVTVEPGAEVGHPLGDLLRVSDVGHNAFVHRSGTDPVDVDRVALALQVVDDLLRASVVGRRDACGRG